MNRICQHTASLLGRPSVFMDASFHKVTYVNWTNMAKTDVRATLLVYI